jgi:hypothetical protein
MPTFPPPGLFEIVPATVQEPLDRTTRGVFGPLGTTFAPVATLNEENQCSPPKVQEPEEQLNGPSEPSPTNSSHSEIATIELEPLTVSVVEPVMLPDFALIVVLPAVAAIAKPPAVIVATAGEEEFHVAALVRSWLLPSLYDPMAVNCNWLPLAIDGLEGATAIETSAAVVVTVSVADPLTVPDTAVIVVVPAPTPVASPPALIVPTLVAEDDHVEELVMSFVLPSLNVPLAANC